MEESGVIRLGPEVVQTVATAIAQPEETIHSQGLNSVQTAEVVDHYTAIVNVNSKKTPTLIARVCMALSSSAMEKTAM
jgi:predicted transcriptional regulator